MDMTQQVVVYDIGEEMKIGNENDVKEANGVLEMIISICIVKRCIRRYMKAKTKRQD